MRAEAFCNNEKLAAGLVLGETKDFVGVANKSGEPRHESKSLLITDLKETHHFHCYLKTRYLQNIQYLLKQKCLPQGPIIQKLSSKIKKSNVQLFRCGGKYLSLSHMK